MNFFEKSEEMLATKLATDANAEPDLTLLGNS